MEVTVGTVADFAPGTAVEVVAADRALVVYNLGGELFALDNRCAHKDEPLIEGVVRNGVVTCPAHLWRFDVRTGSRTDAAGFAVPCHPVSVIADTVVVEVPAPQPQPSMREMLLEHARTWDRGDGFEDG